MKNTNYIYYICLCLMISWGCEDIIPPLNQPQRITATVTEITETSARYSVSVDHTDAVSTRGIEYGMDPLLDSHSAYIYREEGVDGPMDYLESGTTYYYRAYAEDKRSNRIYGDIESFTTQKPDPVFSNSITAASSFEGGTGTQSDPYLIVGARQLKKLVDDVYEGNNYQGSCFKLTADIQVTADEWRPIGTSIYFRGVFDGDGHTISGILKSANYLTFGFFGMIDGATVSNITIAAAVKNEYSSTENSCYTGGLTGYAVNSHIQNCKVSGPVTGGTGKEDCITGGVVGFIIRNSTIRDCNVSGTVTEGSATSIRTGGVLGAAWTFGSNETPSQNTESFLSVSNCTVSGSVIGSDQTGGIAGYTLLINITNCTVSASGSITGRVGYATGGLVGLNRGKIHTSLNAGSITSFGNYTGGLVGYNGIDGNVYSCCTNRGTVNGQPAGSSNQIGSGRAVITCPDGHEKR
jgi:hypothetical protein